jgi:hypothetical protein
VVTRRALLGAGAAGAGALLAGCGPPDTKAVSRQDVLDEQLRLTRLSVAAGAPRAHARAKKLEAAGAVAKPAGAPSGNAYEAERRALAGYVAAIGKLRDPASRTLLGELVADAAESEAEPARELKLDPLRTAFPGLPA